MIKLNEALPPAPERAPDLDDDFTSGVSQERWIAHYLPHWSTPDRSEARYQSTPDGLRLLIEQDQLDWRPEDAPLRVSNIQSGNYSGPLGSTTGTHRHRPDNLTVRTQSQRQLLFAPSSGRIELTVSATKDEGCMLAAWLVGTEHLSPEDSGEICIFEIDAEAIGEFSTARVGLKAHHDPRMVSDMSEVKLPLNAALPHTWAVIWDESGTIIGCDGLVVRRIPQSPNYPMFLMIDIFENGSAGGTYPKNATIHRVKGWNFDSN